MEGTSGSANREGAHLPGQTHYDTIYIYICVYVCVHIYKYKI